MRRLAACLLFLLAACAPRVAPPSLTVPPVAEADLLARLAGGAEAFRSLQGEAKVKISNTETSLTVNQILFAAKPASLRSETLNPFGFGSPIALMATDGQEMSVFLPGQGSFYRGAASPRNVMRFTKVPLQLPDLVRLLLYDVPVLPYRNSTVDVDEDGAYRLTLVGAGEVRQELRFDQELRLVDAGYFYRDDLQLRVRYAGFNGEAPPFPMRARFEMPGTHTEASLTFSQVQTNVDIPAKRFQLQPPPGVTVLPIP